jgi:hypothetical protein
MNAIKDLISDIEAMRSSKGDMWFGPFSQEDDGHIEWPNLHISLNNVKARLPQLDAAEIIDKLSPILIQAGCYVGPKLANELTIRLNDLLQGGETDAKEHESTQTL